MTTSNPLPAPSDTDGAGMLLPILVGGMLLGGGANVSALISGKPIWAGLVYQSGFGMFGMFLVAAILLTVQAWRDRRKVDNSMMKMKTSSAA